MKKRIIKKIFKYAYNFLSKSFDVITGFSMSLFICLTKLMVVIVMLFMIINQNMDHIMDQKAL